jgi:hypothetical protein
MPGDPSPPTPAQPPSPPAGPAAPTAAAARVPADLFGGRIVAEPDTPQAAATALNAMLLRLDALIARSLDPAAQREVAALVALVPRLERPQNASLVAVAERAVTALAQTPPQVELAAQLRDSIRRATRGIDNFRRAIRFTTPAVRVLLGLMIFLVGVMPLMLLAAIPGAHRALDRNMNPDQVLMVGVAGAIGSIISIMVRIQDFDRSSGPDATSQVFVGALRPVIGIGIALFAYTVVKAGILPIGVPAEQAPFFFAALAFISGFSERLANDLVAKTEQTLSEAIRGNAPQPAAAPVPQSPSGTAKDDAQA